MVFLPLKWMQWDAYIHGDGIPNPKKEEFMSFSHVSKFNVVVSVPILSQSSIQSEVIIPVMVSGTKQVMGYSGVRNNNMVTYQVYNPVKNSNLLTYKEIVVPTDSKDKVNMILGFLEM